MGRSNPTTINIPGGSRLSWNGDAVFEEVEAKLFDAQGEFAEKVAAQARANAPKGPDQDLANSIKAVKVKGSISGKLRHWAVRAGSKHAAFVELGTQRSKRQPYLWPAFESLKDDLIKMVKNIIGK